MAAANKFNPFIEKVMEKVYNLGSDQMVVALSPTANTPTATNSILTDLTQISYTNLSTRNVTTTSSAQTSGTYKLILVDLVLTAGGGAVAAFRFITLYDDTATNDDLILWWDYGTSLTLNDTETLTLDFDGSAGVVQAA